MILNKRSFIAQNPIATMKKTTLALEVCVMLGLVGCAGPDYDARLPVGHEVTQRAADTDIFFVTYRGEGSTSEEIRVQDFAYYRAAKVTLEKGFICFAVVDDKFQYVTAQSTNSFVQFYQPEDTLQIKCFQTKPDGIYTFDAAFLVRSLNQKYSMK